MTTRNTRNSMRAASARTDRITRIFPEVAVSDPAKTQVIKLVGDDEVNIAADSHAGFARLHNEDSFGYFTSPKNRSILLAVADGIGGHDNGDIASHLTIKFLLSAWRAYQRKGRFGTEPVSEFLRTKLEQINSALFALNSSCNIPLPMGTTVAAMILLDRHVVCAHAGDSRIYRLRRGSLDQLTQDHSVTSDLIRAGTLTEESVATHPMAHVILKSLGPAEPLTPEIRVCEHRYGDRYLVCSDGLMLHLNNTVIKDILESAVNAQTAAKNLINSTLRCGGGDNVTVLCYFA